jgi:ribosomal protein L24E
VKSGDAMANRRCYKCGIKLDGGEGVMIVKFDWDIKKWLRERDYCDKCFRILERKGGKP